MKATKRRFKRSRKLAVLGAALLLATAVATGCASSDGETCDGAASPSTVNEAVRGLIEAAEASDPHQACKVATEAVDDNEMVEALAGLREQLDKLEIDSATANIVEGEQGGSLIPVEIRSSGSSEATIEFDVLSIREEGYRVYFPES